MRSVYKYLPREFVPALLEGRILFRNLVYFKRLERDPRWDVFEGGHIDAPDHDVHMDNLTTGKRITGPFVFHNTLEYGVAREPLLSSCEDRTRLSCSSFGGISVRSPPDPLGHFRFVSCFGSGPLIRRVQVLRPILRNAGLRFI